MARHARISFLKRGLMMLKGFEEFQKVGKDGFDAAVKSFGEMNKGFQAIAATVADACTRATV